MNKITERGWIIELPGGLFGFVADGEIVPSYAKLTNRRGYINELLQVFEGDPELSTPEGREE